MDVELHNHAVSHWKIGPVPHMTECILERFAKRVRKHNTCGVAFNTSCDLEGQKSSVFDVLLRDRIR